VLEIKLHELRNLQLLNIDLETQIDRTKSPDFRGRLCSDVALSNVPGLRSVLATGIHEKNHISATIKGTTYGSLVDSKVINHN